MMDEINEDLKKLIDYLYKIPLGSIYEADFISDIESLKVEDNKNEKYEKLKKIIKNIGKNL